MDRSGNQGANSCGSNIPSPKSDKLNDILDERTINFETTVTLDGRKPVVSHVFETISLGIFN